MGSSGYRPSCFVCNSQHHAICKKKKRAKHSPTTCIWLFRSCDIYDISSLFQHIFCNLKWNCSVNPDLLCVVSGELSPEVVSHISDFIKIWYTLHHGRIKPLIIWHKQNECLVMLVPFLFYPVVKMRKGKKREFS